ADRFAHSDLDVVDVAAIPYRFEETVGKTHHHDVLHRLFPQVMVDSVNLTFTKVPSEEPVEFVGRRQIAAKGFLDDHPAKPAASARPFHFAEPFDQLRIEAR